MDSLADYLLYSIQYTVYSSADSSVRFGSQQDDFFYFGSVVGSKRDDVRVSNIQPSADEMKEC